MLPELVIRVGHWRQLVLEVEILVTPLDAVERQSEEGAVQVVPEVDFLVLPLSVVDRHSEGRGS